MVIIMTARVQEVISRLLTAEAVFLVTTIHKEIVEKWHCDRILLLVLRLTFPKCPKIILIRLRNSHTESVAKSTTKECVANKRRNVSDTITPGKI